MMTTWILGVFALILLITLILIVLIIAQKYAHEHRLQTEGLARDYLFMKYYDGKDVELPCSVRMFFDVLSDVLAQVEIETDVLRVISNDLKETRYYQRLIKHLDHASLIKRKRAIFYLSLLKDNDIIAYFKSRFHQEKNATVKIMLLRAMINDLDLTIVQTLVSSIIRGSKAYHRWASALFQLNYQQLKPYIQVFFETKDIKIISFLLKLTENHLDQDLRDYTQSILESDFSDISLKVQALSSLSKLYPEMVFVPIYLNHEHPDMRILAIHAGSQIVDQKTVDSLLGDMDGSSFDVHRTKALSRIIYDSRTLLLSLLNLYPKAKNLHEKKAIARVLSHRIDFLVVHMKTGEYPFIKAMISQMLELHILEDLIDFMNANQDQQIEQILLTLIKPYLLTDSYVLEQFSIYLKQESLERVGLLKKPLPTAIREKPAKEKKRTVWILRWIIIAIFTLPMIYVLTNITVWLRGGSFSFIAFLVSMNYYLVFYFLIVNGIYLLLLVISVHGAKLTKILWKMKQPNLLFQKDLLPSISIIAPAYNEEVSIIESVTALLNLKYPKFEVIVVNDGSKDQTIDRLKTHFELERKHPFFSEKIATKPIRGVYVNRLIPNLIVIDKQNGGKADALNVGINVSKNDFICGIDADSLLEEDALLKLMSVILDDEIPHLALGGNIVPVNGSVVDRGKIESHGLGKKPLVRFQTLEYLRAFTTGRIGWSRIRSLLIISGAFGMFNRLDLLDAGGYLTSSSKHKKDTVGEDMELVVRLTRRALEEKKKYRVTYVHHANCYTELPSDFKTLLKQRNRWHRGLLDILSYHRKLVLHPKYKQPGLIGFTYFFIFEMMGPFIEVTGYLFLILSFILGLLNLEIFMLLFSVTIGLGIMISLFSLFIAESDMIFYSKREMLVLIGLAIIENFGYRQIISLHRVYSTFSALRESGVWGAQKRMGFKKVSS